MSVLEKIKKLDQEKAALLGEAKREALDTIHKAIATLNDLGFSYKLVTDGGPATKSTGTRRTGVRDDVLKVVKSKPNGITRSQILEAMNAKGNKSAEQSISNALAALKKAGSVSAKDGIYRT